MRVKVGFLGLVVALASCGGSESGGGIGSDDGGADGSSGGASGTNGSSGTAGGAGGQAGTSGGGGAGGGGVCTVACAHGFMCCGGACVNPNNDILNCGGCGVSCKGTAPFCAGGSCGMAPCAVGTTCTGDKGTCCGDLCCGGDQLCCVVPGPVEQGPRCTTPVNGTCPVGCPDCRCAAPTTPIATPEGSRPIASLRVGDLVYSLVHEKMAAVPVREVRRVPALGHVVTRLVLESGVVLEISGMHPTADGRRFADLRAGEDLDGVRVLDTRIVPYAYDATYDILPDSDSGAYFAGGVLIGSTLAGVDARHVRSTTAPTCR